MASGPDLTIYYDASCSVCRTEFHTLKAADNNNRLALVDCSERLFADRSADRDGVDRAAMMQVIHVRSADGTWYRDVDAFHKIFATMGIRPMARFWGSAHLRPILKKIYPWVARHRQALSRLPVHGLIAWTIKILAVGAKRPDDATPH